MNKKLLFTIGIIILVVLGYFAMQEEAPQSESIMQTDHMQPHNIEQAASAGLEIHTEAVIIPFKKSYSIDEDWSIIIKQFEPDAKIVETGTISSDSNQEINPAVKVEFFKNGDLIHYQISYREMPGFHSVKPGQKYLLDLIDYKGFNDLGDNIYSIESANVKIWRIK